MGVLNGGSISPPHSRCHTWQGLYTVEERVRQVNYHLPHLGMCRDTQTYHVNLIKPWVEPNTALSAAISFPLVRPPFGGEQHPPQRQDLEELCNQHLDVFPELPGQTHVLPHNIKTPPGVTIHQRPYQVPEAKRKAIEAEVNRILWVRIIEESYRPLV